MLKRTKTYLSNIDSTILFFTISGLFIMVILSGLHVMFIRNWEDVLVEAHGLLFDIILFGIILTVFSQRIDKKMKILRCHEEIEDFLYWEKRS